MYYPILRGKQFELIALREFVTNCSTQHSIVPLIEPVKDNILVLNNTLHLFESKGMKAYVIMNPSVGYFKSNPQPLSNILDGFTYVRPAYYVNNSVLPHMRQGQQLCLIHLTSLLNETKAQQIKSSSSDILNVVLGAISRGYRSQVTEPENCALLSDYFPREEKNSLYPEDNSFTDELFFYKSEGRIGFSDYSVIGKDYSESGGPAYSVVLHHIYADMGKKELRLKHFVSDSHNGTSDPGGKFMEALEKLITWANSNPSLIYESCSMTEYRRLYNEAHYPGLGYLKKLAILHHLELCNHIIETEGY